ncbi:MAG: MerR family transcriptional regulator [Halanaerobium sp.]|nr:MerR family transcriptional regulator [Halanaerobium sp.]
MIHTSKPIFPMGTACTLTGLTPRQIRYYDLKGLIFPGRTAGNQRLFSPDDITKLYEIKRLLQRGMKVGQVKAYFKEQEIEQELGLNQQRGLHQSGDRSLYPPSYLDQLIKELLVEN